MQKKVHLPVGDCYSLIATLYELENMEIELDYVLNNQQSLHTYLLQQRAIASLLVV